MKVNLNMTIAQYSELKKHLFSGDGKESVAIALCGRRTGVYEHKLLIRKITTIPDGKCTFRANDRVTWPTETLIPLLTEAADRNLGILKIHSHPEGYPAFSDVDDESDRNLFDSIYSWIDNDLPHASAIMLPDGKIFGRTVKPELNFTPLESVNVVGDDLLFWASADKIESIPENAIRNAQMFGSGTSEKLHRLKVAIIGCSGTGSLVVEQLARLNVGSLVLVDPDYVEEKNLNRIVNATREDAKFKRFKVDVMRRAIDQMGFGTKVETFAKSLSNVDVVRAVSGCDILFGCMDSIDGRHLLNRLATYYLIPYFDVGVKLEADGKGGIDQVCGAVHYLQPGCSSLLSRRVYSREGLDAAYLKITDPAEYKKRLKSKYIIGIQEDRPAVISVNMLAASLAVNEFIARLHPYRLDKNGEFAYHTLSFSHDMLESEAEKSPCPSLTANVGKGDVEPLLDMPELTL